MKRFSVLALFLTISLILSACRTQATPTASPIDFQGTVAAAAFTVIAETQAAIPTATPSPTATITNTPAPTNTPLPLPFSDATSTPVPNGNSGGSDPCINKTMPEILQGEPVRMRISNTTKVPLSVSVYLNQVVPNGQCGYRGYTLAPGEAIVLNNLVEGCYTLWAWNPDPDNYFIVTNGTNCIDKSETSSFGISTSNIKLNP